MEKDPDFYRWFISVPKIKFSGFSSLLIPVTFRCNMNCKYCYAHFPKREDITFKKLVEVVKGFEGGVIGLTGGEPTVRDDLVPIITAIKALGKKVRLVTNGLKFSDPKYLKSLLDAGLDSVFLSFDSFNERIYKDVKIPQKGHMGVLELKKRALANLEAGKIQTIFAATIYPGINDGEINDLFAYAFNKASFITELRLISCVKPAAEKERGAGGYFLSEMLEQFSRQLGVDMEMLKTRFFQGREGKRLIFSLEGFWRGGRFEPYLEKGSAPKKLRVQLAHSYTLENIDIEALKCPSAYLCHDNTLCDLLLGIVRDGMNFSNEAMAPIPDP